MTIPKTEEIKVKDGNSFLGESIGSTEIGCSHQINRNGHIHGIGAQEDAYPGKTPTQAQASDGETCHS